MDSTKGPIIKAGTEVEALETRTLDSGVLRVRIAEDQWVSERTGKGDLILEPLGDTAEVEPEPEPEPEPEQELQPLYVLAGREVPSPPGQIFSLFERQPQHK